jgi:membrane protease YdiL (CAAX protease family)
MLVGFILFGGIVAALFGEKVLMESKDMLYILFGVQQLVTLVVLWWAMDEWGVSPFANVKQYFDERRERKGWELFWGRVVGGFLFYVLINAGVYRLLDYMDLKIPWLYGEQWVMEMLEWLDITATIDWILTIAMIVIIGPIVEELVYRWLVTDLLMQKWRRGWVVLWACIFALIHLEFAVFWNLFFLALILWVIYYKTRSMWYSLLFHMIINGMGLLALWAEQRGYVIEWL